MRSIQTKFIALILGCILLCSSIVGGVSILNSYMVVDAYAARTMNLQCSEQATVIDGIFERIEQSVTALSLYTLKELESVEKLKSDPQYLLEYTKKLEDVAVNTANSTEGSVAIYVRFNPDFTPPTSGLFWSRVGTNSSFKQLTPTDLSAYSPDDVEHVGWYYIPTKNYKAIWMPPYFNRNINVKMISYVVPIYSNNETVGVVGMDIDFSIIENLVDDIKIYKNGYGFLTDEKDTLMSHPVYAMGTPIANIGSNMTALLSELKKGNSMDSLLSYDWDGEWRKMTVRTLKNGMRLALTAPSAEIDTAKNTLTLQISIASLLVAAISVVLTIYLTRRLVKPLRELNEAAKKIAAGDLSISLIAKTKDEVGTLSESFQQTVGHLQKYISYINGLAYRDALTGVKNKTAYQDAVKGLEEQMRTGCPSFGVVVMDINGLKEVNDSKGHDFGDMLIAEASKIICRIFRHSPVYRIGGDEFVAILENADYANYENLLDEFQKETEGNVSIARGVAIYNRDTDLIFANVFQRADDAMYQNKAAMKARQSTDFPNIII